MTRTIFLAASALLLGGCATDDAADTNFEVTATGYGEQAYNEYCAGCHETGMLGAPIVGESEDWESRSDLWDAVLFDHAITGYLEMPAKGGRNDLPDDVVKAAAEYMLQITYPDRPQDCVPPACGDTQ